MQCTSTARDARSDAGFTLIELMVTVAVLAILLGIALPSFLDSFERSRERAALESVTTAVKYARSEALNRNRQVTLCASNAAQTGCSGAADWAANGWLALVVNPAPPNTVLRVWDRPSGQTAINAPAQVLFNANGSLAAQAGLSVKSGSMATVAMCINVSGTLSKGACN